MVLAESRHILCEEGVEEDGAPVEEDGSVSGGPGYTKKQVKRAHALTTWCKIL